MNGGDVMETSGGIFAPVPSWFHYLLETTIEFKDAQNTKIESKKY